MRFVQLGQANHHQPAWRIRDRAPADAAEQLLDRHNDDPLHLRTDVDFRCDYEHGRLVWTIDGEDYTKTFFPQNLRNLEFTPQSAIAEMDYCDVDMVLLHTNPMLGRDSAYLARCCRMYPDRLRSMAPVDEWRIRDETDAVIGELEDSIRNHGLHAIKFIPPFAYHLAGPEPWDDGYFRPFWEAATGLGVPVFLTLGAHPDFADQREGYLNELRVLMRWMARYPDTVCSLTHGFPWRAFVDGDGITLPDEIWEPFKSDRCNIEVSFPIRIGDLFDYPYRQVWPTLEEMVERIGAHHLLWGTDMPFQNRFCTYRQSRQWIEDYCSFLTAEDLALIMGGTAARILGLDQPVAPENPSVS